MKFERKITLHSFSLLLLYLNVSIALFSIYTFNIASKFLIWLSMWAEIVINSIGLFSILYMNYIGIGDTKIALKTNILSMPGLYFTLQSIYGENKSTAQIEEIYMNEYEKISTWYVRFECVCIGGLLFVIVGSLLRQFMKVHIKTEPERQPVILTSTIVEPTSLRSNPTMIAVK